MNEGIIGILAFIGALCVLGILVGFIMLILDVVVVVIWTFFKMRKKKNDKSKNRRGNSYATESQDGRTNS